ncbi:MAG TPA: DUF2189 domain-containing protein [Lichenihabitans sp.]|jgi:uncharacterized membrane protein|nr:DUF2189 domain-containing protein [Lichenihabitans sp.]
MTHIGVSSMLAGNAEPLPEVRRISTDDLKAALREGFDDFWAMPSHVIFLVIIYPIIGLVIARVTMDETLLPIAYPLMAGFALLGPFAALGLYELSRRREQGLDTSWTHAFDVLHSPSINSILALGAVLMLIFIAWIGTAQALYAGLLGDVHPHSFPELVRDALSTSGGRALIVLGNGFGFLFAVVAMSVSVVSLPLLLDRPVGAMAAAATSIRAVRENPGPMAIWGLIIALGLLVGTVTLFIGLALILPIFGHATWHLYRRLVIAPADRVAPPTAADVSTPRL